MKRTLLTLTLAAQVAAFGAYAQTTASTASSTTAMTTGTSISNETTFGSDWSPTLGPAMFREGGTMIRVESDLASQWNTLSDDDKAMIRRDCDMHEQHTTGTTMGAASINTGVASTTSNTRGAAGTAGTTIAGTDPNRTTLGTTGTTGTTDGSTTATTTGSTETAMGTTGPIVGTTDGSSPVMNVSMEQMAEICAATNSL